jgi:hypothetical protein
MIYRVQARSASALASLVAMVVMAGCGSKDGSQFDGGAPGLTGNGDGGVILTGDSGGISGGQGSTGIITPSGPVTDFPEPVLDGNAPSNSSTLFGPASQGASSGGPCIVEPENDVIYPQNWLRPRFRWTTVAGQNLFELRLHVANQNKDLLVYSTDTSWTMPLAMWNKLRTDSPTEPITLTIRGAVVNGGTLTGESTGSSYPMGIAPVQATGAIVYWTTSDNSALKGFSPGDESVAQVLIPSQVAETNTTCLGCHTSAPGGEYVGFGIQGQTGWPNAIALIDQDAGTVGTTPPFLGAGGSAALAQYDQGITSFSAAHWATGDRREILAYAANEGDTNILRWIDLEAATLAGATGTITRTGDPSSAAAPSWSHDGNTIAYMSTSHFCDGRIGAGCSGNGAVYNGTTDMGSTADLYTVPYASGAGGTATAVSGASDPMLQEYYPVFSPDDTWLAFDRIKNDLNMYNQPQAEVFVIPSGGGKATRLAANDPPMCSGAVSPGVTNSWPKWGPTALSANGSTYYWLVFSSTRSDGGIPQLYITSIVEAGGKITTHGSIYLWNQPAMEHNHTPAWDTFKVPKIPPPPAMPPPK